MIRSRENYQYYIKNIILSPGNNPLTWTNEQYTAITDGQMIIGYCFLRKKVKFNNICEQLNLYLLRTKYCDCKTLNLDDLKCGITLWYAKSKTDVKAVSFVNPPIKQWYDTKDNWLKFTANKFSKKYSKHYDDVMSIINLTILTLFKAGLTYMGNLWYITTAINNNILMEIRYNKNKIVLDNKNVFSLDATLNNDEDNSIDSYHELIGSEDNILDTIENTEHYNELKLKLFKDLSKTFSNREIEQILNATKAYNIPNETYRRLLRWRHKHTRSDYV